MSAATPRRRTSGPLRVGVLGQGRSGYGIHCRWLEQSARKYRIAAVADLLADNHLTLLGYPGNLDEGEEIHQVTSGDWFDFGDGTVAYGSDMGGGSSGGPWIQNFNRKARGQGGGRNRARLAVTGVASFGFVDDAIRAQGASKLDRNFKVLRQDACRNQAGNC